MPVEIIKGLFDEDDEKSLVVVTEDQQKITVPRKVGRVSGLLQTITEGDHEAIEIPLTIKGHVMKKIVSYMTYHYQNPAKLIEKPLKSKKLDEVVCKFDADFIDVDQEFLYDLVLAANYLDIDTLLDLCSAKIASLIIGKSVEEIRHTFNIENDFTAAEEEAVRAENAWATNIV